MKLRETMSDDDLASAMVWIQKNVLHAESYKLKLENGKFKIESGPREFIFRHRVTACPFEFDLHGGELSLLDLENISNLDDFEIPVNYSWLRVEACDKLKSLDRIGEAAGPMPKVEIETTPIETLKDLPETVEHLYLRKCDELTSFETSTVKEATNYVKLSDLRSLTSLIGLPRTIGGSLIIADCPKLTSLAGINKTLKNVKIIDFSGDSAIESNILGLMKVNVEMIRADPSIRKTRFGQALAILKEFLQDGDIVECQAKLIDEGFEEFAKM